MNDETFLRAIREQPEEEVNWLVYADWLDDQGDPRGEVLRILSFVGIMQNLEYYPEQRARFEELRRAIDGEWLDQTLRLWALRFRPYEHSGRPSLADVDAMWDVLEIRWVPRRNSERPQPVRELPGEVSKRGFFPWNQAVLEQFTLSQHPVLAWFGSRQRWADLQLVPRLAASSVVHRALFGKAAVPPEELTVQNAAPPGTNWDVHTGPATAFAEQFADCLSGERYESTSERYGRTRSSARAVGVRVAASLYGERLSEVRLCHARAEWAPWSCLLAQDTWIFIDPRDWSLSVLIVAGGD